MRPYGYKSHPQTPRWATIVSTTIDQVRRAFQRGPFVRARSENNTDTRTVFPAPDRQAGSNLRCAGSGIRCSSAARARVQATAPKPRRLPERPNQILPGQLGLSGAHRAIREDPGQARLALLTVVSRLPRTSWYRSRGETEQSGASLRG